MSRKLTNKELVEEVYKVNELLGNRTKEYLAKIEATEKELATANAQLRMAKQDIDRKDLHIRDRDKTKIAINAAILSRLVSAYDKGIEKQTEWVGGQLVSSEGDLCDEVRFLRFLHGVANENTPF